MRILVTGGAGYIGSFTVRALQERGHDVTVYDNLSSGHREAATARLVVGDMGDAAALDTCLAESSFDAIVHFAAYIEVAESMVEAGRYFQNNTATAITLLNAAAHHGIKHFVFSSTAAVYGNPLRVPIKESDPTVPVNVYGETKLLVERMLPWYDRVHGIGNVALRYFNAAGAALDGSMGQDRAVYSHIMPLAMQALLGQRDRFLLFGDDYPTPDGTCIRDYIHVLDLTSAHVLALEHLAAGGPSDVFNIGTGRGHSNREVVAMVERVSGRTLPVQVAPRRPGDATELVADPTHLRQTLGWEPRFSDLETIVTSTWKWHSTHPQGYATPAPSAV